MPKPELKPQYHNLQYEIRDTMLAGLKQWRSDLSYPESHSDMQACIHALLREFEIKRRPISLEYSEIIIDE